MPKFEIIGTFITKLRADTEDEARRIIYGNLDYNLGIDPNQTIMIVRECEDSEALYSADNI